MFRIELQISSSQAVHRRVKSAAFEMLTLFQPESKFAFVFVAFNYRQNLQDVLFEYFLLCTVFVNRSFAADSSPARTGVKRDRQRAQRR